ncbi:octaprenyl-diphosphate synthase [Escherichia coli]|nr:octaprenyl-diphosphate synthase [Escherichia coli]
MFRDSGWLYAGRGERLQDYGRYLGTAFQLIDDLLDYNADGEQLGKNVGDDLNEGKPTLPLLHAMHHGTPEQAQMIRTAIEQVTVAIFWNRFRKQ